MSDDQKFSADDSGTEDSFVTEENQSSEENSSPEASQKSAEGTSEEKWVVPGRFKTVDDVFNGYRNIETAYTQTRQELAELRRKMESPQQADPEEEIGQFAEAVKRNPVEAVRSVMRRELTEYEKKQQAGRFVNTYNEYMRNNEFRELEPVMTQMAEQVAPMIRGTALENNPVLLDYLFLAARGAKQAELTKQAETRGAQAGEAAAVKKTKAQIEGSSSSRGKTTKRFEDLSLEEMRRALERGDA